MRPLNQAERRATKNILDRSDQSLLLRIVLLQQDAAEAVMLRPVIPDHVHQPFASVAVMKQRRVETGTVEINGFGPGAFNRRGRYQKIAHILEAARPAPGI